MADTKTPCIFQMNYAGKQVEFETGKKYFLDKMPPKDIASQQEKARRCAEHFASQQVFNDEFLRFESSGDNNNYRAYFALNRIECRLGSTYLAFNEKEAMWCLGALKFRNPEKKFGLEVWPVVFNNPTTALFLDLVELEGEASPPAK